MNLQTKKHNSPLSQLYPSCAVPAFVRTAHTIHVDDYQEPAGAPVQPSKGHGTLLQAQLHCVRRQLQLCTDTRKQHMLCRATCSRTLLSVDLLTLPLVYRQTACLTCRTSLAMTYYPAVHKQPFHKKQRSHPRLAQTDSRRLTADISQLTSRPNTCRGSTAVWAVAKKQGKPAAVDNQWPNTR